MRPSVGDLYRRPHPTVPILQGVDRAHSTTGGYPTQPRLRHSSRQVFSDPLPIGRILRHSGEQQDDAVQGTSGQDSVDPPRDPLGLLRKRAIATEWNVSVWGKRRAFTEHVEKLAELVSAKTNGEFTMNVSYGGLSKNRENLDGISIGAFEMAQFCAGYHPDKNRVVTVLELPFLGVANLAEEVAVSHAVYAHPAATEEMAQWNARLLMTSPMPQYNIVGTGDPRRTHASERQ